MNASSRTNGCYRVPDSFERGKLDALKQMSTTQHISTRNSYANALRTNIYRLRRNKSALPGDFDNED